MRVAAALALAAVLLTTPASAGEDHATLRITGSPDARVRYACEFAQGGHDEGTVTPPFEETWPVTGLSCRFEITGGAGTVAIRLEAAGNAANARLSGPGSRMRLRQGMPRLPE